MKLIPLFIFACTVLSTFSAHSASQKNHALEQLLDEMWQFHGRARPIQGASWGIKESTALLPDLSPETLEANHQQRSMYLQQLSAFEELPLPLAQQIDLKIRKHLLEDRMSKYKYKHHYIPVTAESGFHVRLAYILAAIDTSSLEGYKNYIKRISQIERYFEQNIYWMNEGIKSGYTQPSASMKGFESSIASYISKDAQSNHFYKPFLAPKPSHISEAQWLTLQTQAQTIIDEQVIPSYQRFYDFFTQTYYPATRKSIGISSLSWGREYYADRVKHFTTTDLSGEEIHQIGLNEVKRIRSEMHSLIKQIGFTGSFAEFLEFLRTDPQFYAKTPRQLLMEAMFIAKTVDGKLPSLFKTLPRRPYTVKPVPDEIAPKYTTGRYFTAQRDDQPGEYWVNTYALGRRPLYELEALTLHEAVPGHHLQAAIGQEQPMRPFRRNYYMSAFGEGWALYAEYLGKEAGMYQDPYSEFGRLTYEMWRACRLVVDTGLHLKGWSRQEAINFMQSNTALTLHNITTETDRYITWPAQALSYKIGELTIKRLRAKAETELGKHFDVRVFHDEVLKNGAVTLTVLEEIIDLYIADVKQRTSHK